jgi:hypothetical protein
VEGEEEGGACSLLRVPKQPHPPVAAWTSEGPTEMNATVLQQIGFNASDVADMVAGERSPWDGQRNLHPLPPLPRLCRVQRGSSPSGRWTTRRGARGPSLTKWSGDSTAPGGGGSHADLASPPPPPPSFLVQLNGGQSAPGRNQTDPQPTCATWLRSNCGPNATMLNLPLMFGCVQPPPPLPHHMPLRATVLRTAPAVCDRAGSPASPTATRCRCRPSPRTSPPSCWCGGPTPGSGTAGWVSAGTPLALHACRRGLGQHTAPLTRWWRPARRHPHSVACPRARAGTPPLSCKGVAPAPSLSVLMPDAPELGPGCCSPAVGCRRHPHFVPQTHGAAQARAGPPLTCCSAQPTATWRCATGAPQPLA